MNTERWHAVGRWVVEDCAEQPEEPMPLFQCDLPANAVTVANIYNEVCTERDAALARIAAVEALHFMRGRNILGRPVCAECSPLQPMPCPTLRALAASPTPDEDVTK